MQYEERTRIATPEGVELELVLAGPGLALHGRGDRHRADPACCSARRSPSPLIAGGGAGLLLAVGRARRLAAALASPTTSRSRCSPAGRTPGKRACGLRVVEEGGEAIGLRASAVRNLLRLLEGPPTFYVPAIVSILATRRNQRLGDLAAGTLVIREPRPRGARRARRAARAAGRRRLRTAEWDVSAITPQELAAIRSFLERRESFTPARPARAGARPRRAARRQGRRPAARAPRRGAARGHRGGEVRPILNTQQRPSREGGSQVSEQWRTQQRQPAGRAAARRSAHRRRVRAARRASGAASPRCSSTA